MTTVKIRALLGLTIILSLSSSDMLWGQVLPQSNSAPMVSGIRQILRRALKEATAIEDPAMRAKTFGTIAEHQARSGDVEGARQTMKSLEQESSKDWLRQKETVLSRIVGAQLKAGNIKAARHTADGMSAAQRRSASFEIAKSQAKAGDMTGAMQTIASLLNNSAPDDRILAELAIAQASGGDLAGARKTSGPIQDVTSRAEVQVAIAVAQAKAGDFTGALKTADSIVFALWGIAWHQAKIGDVSGALQTANLVPEGAGDSRAAGRVFLLQAIAIAQVEAGDFGGAMKTSSLIKEEDMRAGVLFFVARAQANAGNFKVALKMIDSIQHVDAKKGLLQEIAVAQTKKGDLAGALATIAGADKTERDPMIARIAEVQAEMGDTNGADKTAALIPEIYRESTVSRIAMARAAAGDASRLIAMAEKGGSPYYRASTLLQSAARLLFNVDEEEKLSSALIPYLNERYFAR